MSRIFWADLHNHNAVGYGRGTLQRSYRIARNLLDIYAFTPHGYWPDPPADDPRMVAYHQRAFDEVLARFPHVVEQAEAAYEPGRFVCFAAYEWHSLTWGDFVVLFPGAEADLCRAESLEELQTFARSRAALLIPHHVAYRRGWRGLDWQSLDATLTPLVEIFSEHGNSFEADALWPMLTHSMGGQCRSQTACAQLALGRHFGFTAGTDTHGGHPGSYGEGITAVLAESLTREGVFEALRKRHTFAATGDRIELDVRSGPGVMGDVLPAGARRELEVEVRPLAPLDFVAVYKNGRLVQRWAGPDPHPGRGQQRYLIRVEWGWDRLSSRDVTQWRIRLGVRRGELKRVVPCLGGGGCEELCNLFSVGPDGTVEIESYTSRLGRRPINGVVLEAAGGEDMLLAGEVRTRTGSESGGCEVRATVGELLREDFWAKVSPRFSAPRIRIAGPVAAEAVRFRTAWRDEDPSARDSYLIKAQQANGQIAWSSPILFADEPA